MPREIPRREQRPSGRTRRFSDLAQVLQLQGAIQEPGLRERELGQRDQATNINAVLQLLGLTQQAGEGTANRALQERELKQRSELAGQQVEAGRQRNLIDTLTLLGQPQVPEIVGDVAGATFPEIAAGQAAGQKRALDKGVSTLEPQVRAIYGSGTAPGKMSPMLDALKLSNPAAFNALPWNELNALIGAPEPPPSPQQDLEQGISPVERGIRNIFRPETLSWLFGPAAKPSLRK